MKKYKIKFQSFSDVITNSSSTVFLVDKDTYEELKKMVPDYCFYSAEITWDNICPDDFKHGPTKENADLYNEIICNVDNNVDMLFDILNKHKDKLIINDPDWYNDPIKNYLDYTNIKQYYDFCQDNKALIEELIIGKKYVDIEDHFEDCLDVYDYATDNCIWWESMH